MQSVPATTARAAKSLFNIENLYLAMGDQLAPLFNDLDLDEMDSFGERPAGTLFVLATVTFFQFVERLPDRQAADAVRTRLDWKYALHLPLDHPGIDASALNEFRRRLQANARGQRVFEAIQSRLTGLGFLTNGNKQQVSVDEVLTTVDALSRAGETREAIGAALEALASSDPEWLRSVALPHWFERYDRQFTSQQLPKPQEKLESLVQAIGADIAYLLQATEKADVPDLALLPEVQALRRVWRQQSEGDDSQVQ